MYFRRLKMSFILWQDVLFKNISECAGWVVMNLIGKPLNNILMERIGLY